MARHIPFLFCSCLLLVACGGYNGNGQGAGPLGTAAPTGPNTQPYFSDGGGKPGPSGWCMKPPCEFNALPNPLEKVISPADPTDPGQQATDPTTQAVTDPAGTAASPNGLANDGQTPTTR